MFTIMVTDVNERPTAHDLVLETDEDTAIDFALPVSDVDGDSLIVTIPQLEHLGSVVIAGNRLTYDPSQELQLQNIASGDSSVQIIVYEVNDDHGEVAQGTIRITVNGVNDWHNQETPTDANRDGFTTHIDALVIINTINKDGPRRLSGQSGEPETFYDVSNDNFVMSNDVLRVINAVNARAVGEGELTENVAIDHVDIGIHLGAPSWTPLFAGISYGSHFLSSSDAQQQRWIGASGSIRETFHLKPRIIDLVLLRQEDWIRDHRNARAPEQDLEDLLGNMLLSEETVETIDDS
jgi:VCBS repeat-containing protein